MSKQRFRSTQKNCVDSLSVPSLFVHEHYFNFKPILFIMKLLAFILFLITSLETNNDICALPAPTGANGAHNGSSLSISWDAVTSATGYQLIVTDLDTEQIIYNEVVTGTSQNVSGVTATHDYRAKMPPPVRAGKRQRTSSLSI